MVLLSCLERSSLTIADEVNFEQSQVWSALHFIDDTVGIVVGGDEWFEGHMAFTIDGGKNWTFRQMGNKALKGVTTNEQNWLAVGIDGYIYHGQILPEPAEGVFERQAFWEYLKDVIFLDQNNLAIAVGGIGLNRGFVQQIATDQWSSLACDTLDRILEAVAQAPDGEIMAVGYGQVLSSKDLGLSWQQTPFRSAHLSDIHFLPAGRAIMCSRQGNIWVREKNETSWSKIKLPFASKIYLNAITSDEDEIWMCGDRGTIIYSSDGGSTWKRIPFQKDEDLNDLSLTSSKVWLAARSGKLFALDR